MHARGAREELAILLPNTMSHVLRSGRHVMPERGAAQPSLFARLTEVLDWVVELPMRRPVMDEVNRLSEQELADLQLIQAKLPGWLESAPDRREQRPSAPDRLTWISPA